MRHFLSFSVILLAILLPALATAHDFEVDGIYYNINGNEATVTFKGSDFDNYSNEYSGSVVIPATVTHNGTTYPVTAIDESAFFKCTGLAKIVIPNSVTEIGSGAFSGCSGLTSINIPNSVTAIRGSVFERCSRLTSIVIPNSVTSIGDYAFYKCEGLTSVSIPNSVTAIGYNGFTGCTGLTSVVVESGNPRYDSRNNCNAIIETANNKLIFGCNNTTIPNSVTSIGDFAFYMCEGLTSVNIPNSVTAIGEGAFNSCTGLTSIYISNSVTSIGFGAFLGCSGLTSIYISNSVTEIGNFAFVYCSGLTSIVVESGNPRYDSRNNCNAIIETANNTLIVGCKNTIIPNSVTDIGILAFALVTELTSINIPNSVTAIDHYAFYNCI